MLPPESEPEAAESRCCTAADRGPARAGGPPSLGLGAQAGEAGHGGLADHGGGSVRNSTAGLLKDRRRRNLNDGLSPAGSDPAFAARVEPLDATDANATADADAYGASDGGARLGGPRPCCAPPAPAARQAAQTRCRAGSARAHTHGARATGRPIQKEV